MDITFNVSYCINDPMDLIEINNIKSLFDVEVIFERVTNSGRAKQTKSGFNFPLFDEAVLTKKCPNVQAITYIQGKGYTHCCSNLSFNNKETHFTKNTLSNYLASEFYNLSSNYSFGDLIKKYNIQNIELENNDSMECNLCEKVMTQILCE